MRQYEMMVILDPEVDERTVKPSLEKYLAVITGDNGTVDNLDVWGRRRLAFPIKKKNDGIYAVINFTSAPDTATDAPASPKKSAPNRPDGNVMQSPFPNLPENHRPRVTAERARSNGRDTRARA